MDGEVCEYCGKPITWRSVYRRRICHRLTCANRALAEATVEEVAKRESAAYLLAHGSDWLQHCRRWREMAEGMAERGEA